MNLDICKKCLKENNFFKNKLFNVEFICKKFNRDLFRIEIIGIVNDLDYYEILCASKSFEYKKLLDKFKNEKLNYIDVKSKNKLLYKIEVFKDCPYYLEHIINDYNQK